MRLCMQHYRRIRYPFAQVKSYYYVANGSRAVTTASTVFSEIMGCMRVIDSICVAVFWEMFTEAAAVESERFCAFVSVQ